MNNEPAHADRVADASLPSGDRRSRDLGERAGAIEPADAHDHAQISADGIVHMNVIANRLGTTARRRSGRLSESDAVRPGARARDRGHHRAACAMPADRCGQAEFRAEGSPRAAAELVVS